MTLAFPQEEYNERLARLRAKLKENGLSLVILSNPANYNYIAGYDAMSYQNTQCLVVPASNEEPVWISRGIDCASAGGTTWLSPGNIIGYADSYADHIPRHAMEAVAAEIRKRGWNKGRIGYEGDAYYFTARAFLTLKESLAEVEFTDVGVMVSWLRAIKSPNELEYMRRAGKIVSKVMTVAGDCIKAGVRENELAGQIMKAQCDGVGEYAGSLPSAPPFILTGEHAGFAHGSWTGDAIPKGSITALELGGAYLRYHASLCRTFSVGEPSGALAKLGNTVQEGLEAAMAAMKPGVTCHDVWAAWQAVLERSGLKKNSRIGYSIGLNYPPTWRENTLSLERGREDVIRENMCFHIICGMFTGDGTNKGDPHYELSETVMVTKTGVELLTNYDRTLQVRH